MIKIKQQYWLKRTLHSNMQLIQFVVSLLSPPFNKKVHTESKLNYDVVLAYNNLKCIVILHCINI